MIRKIKNKKIVPVFFPIFQIFLLINAIAAYSYFAGISDNFYSSETVFENENERIFDLGINLLIGFLTIKQIGTVSANNHDKTWCCIETDAGASCQDIPVGDSNSCSNPSPTNCDLTSECKPGTCFDEEQGTCSANSPQKSCEDGGGIWDIETDLNNVKINNKYVCRLGCCVLGANSKLTTEKQCDILSEAASIEDEDFIPDLTELECIAISVSLSDGACVLQGGDCRFVKGKTCSEMNGEFTENSLCTNPTLNTKCKPTEETKCSEINGKYNVYFKDSCENIANVYDSSKIFDGEFDGDDEYWEKIQEPSCYETVNSQSCGICNYPAESKCLEVRDNIDPTPTYGNYICRDLTCRDDNGKIWKNGESWCVYESKVGDSKDIVGSDHWLKSCEEGEIKIDKTQNKYRGEVCAQKDLDLGNGETFSVAQYRPNLWPLCSQIAIENNRDKEECNEIPDCRVLSVNVYPQFKFDVCVPKYPKGFDLSVGADNSDERSLCGFATQTCTYVEVKKNKLDDWDPYGGSEACASPTFLEQMNEFCYSLGDCGGYVNVEGKYTKNYKIETGEKGGELNNIDLKNKYLGNKNPSINDDLPKYRHNPDTAGSYGDYGGLVSGLQIPTEEDLNQDLVNTFRIIGAIVGGIIGAGTPVGWFFGGVIGALVGQLIADFVGAEIKTHTIKYVCEPWQAPIGGADCEKCNEGDLPCTQYKCNSLGTACGLINLETNPICINEHPDDSTPPQINFLKVENVVNKQIYNFNEEVNGVEITDCVEELSTLNLSFKTEDLPNQGYARCMYDFNPVDFNLIAQADFELGDVYNLGENDFFIEHNLVETISLSKEGVYDIIETDTETTGKLNIYMRCQDPAGNTNIEEYEIRFCISSEDKTAPWIKEFIPESNSFLKFEDTSTTLSIVLNEPADCKYDSNPGVDYDNMANDFDFCTSDISSGNLEGTCTTTLEGLTKDENTIYIKCRDTSGNTHQTDIYTYTLFASPSELVIDSISPQGEIKGKGIYFPIDLKVTTSGGSKDGEAICSYDFEIHTQFSTNPFASTGGKNHKQTFTSLRNGNYEIKVTCTDSAGNKAEDKAIFDLKVDVSAPKIVRAYKEGNSLKLISDEEAKCYYSNDKIKECRFNINDASSMSLLFSTEHSVDWDKGKTYFVKCKDLFENTNRGCAIKVNPT